MNILDAVNALIVGIGIPTIIGASIYIGRKLQILDDLKGIRDKFTIVESRVNDLWEDRLAPARSPRRLNERGLKILEMSGIKEIINEKREKLTDIVKQTKPMNPYDAEQTIMATVYNLPKHCPDIVEKLKKVAFKSGDEIDGVLFVGAIYLRDIIFEELGFHLEDI